MKTTIKIILILSGIQCLTKTYGQTKQYYLDANGDIKDEKSYIIQKEKTLNSMKKVSKTIDIYEELIKEYSRNDSVVYSYMWHFTDDVKKTKLEIEKKKALIGKIYPIKKVKTLDGRLVSIEDFKGKPTLINLWFTSCKPCIEEMPVLNKLKKEYGNRFNFLSITFESESRVKLFLQRFDFDFDHIVNSKELTTKLGFDGYPVNLFLDKDGILREIKGNIPFDINKNGELEVSDGSDFIKILEKFL